LYTSCVLGLRPFALFNELLLIKKIQEISPTKDKGNCSQ